MIYREKMFKKAAEYVEADHKGKIEKFSGDASKWPMWRMDFRAVLMNEDLLEFLISDEPRPTRESAAKIWDRYNFKVYAKLALCTSGSAKGLVQAFDETLDGKGAWAVLVSKYETKNLARRTTLQQELFNSKLEAHVDPDDYFTSIEEKQRQLKTMSLLITDDIMVGIVLGNMPQEYKTLRTICDMVDKMTYEDLKERVRQYYRRDLADQDGAPRMDGAARMALMAMGGKCYACKKPGHRVSECPMVKAAIAGGNDVCFNCGGRGHRKSECPSGKNEEANLSLKSEHWQGALCF